MRVLLDTNIVLDYLGANQGFTEDAEKVFDLAWPQKERISNWCPHRQSLIFFMSCVGL